MPMEPVMCINDYGDKIWRVNGTFHRTDGPAIIRKDGSQEWIINGKLHRTDGPAVIRKNQYKAWWVNGKLHRTDGPAVVLYNGTKTWWINHKEITQEVNDWMRKQGVTWPWDSETHAQFVLTFS
jgi:hypothetical protein